MRFSIVSTLRETTLADLLARSGRPDGAPTAVAAPAHCVRNLQPLTTGA